MKLLAIGLALAAPIVASAAKLITDGETTLFSSVEKTAGEVYTLETGATAATSNLVVTVESAVAPFATFADSSELGELAGSGYIGAIAATTNTSGTAKWVASSGSDWVVLSGHTPATNTAYTVKTELDFGAKKLRHSVKSGAGAYTTLYKTTSGDWLTANVGKPALSSILAWGDFNTATLSGSCPASSNIAVADAGSISFEPDALSTIGITGDAAAIASALNADGSNGLKNWQNYVLGISTAQANAKPYAAPVQNADSAKLTFSLGGVNVNASSGATVKYGVQVADSPTSFSDGPSEWKDPSETVEMSADSSGVKYYRVKVQITTP